VRRADGRVRITAQLIRTSDQTHLWSESFDRKFEDILAIQGDVASHIARSLALELLPEQQQALARSATPSSAAYEDFLRGRFHLNRRSEEGFAKSVEYFQLAISKDPNFALAHAGFAEACNVCGLYGSLPPRIAYEQAKAAAQQALAIDDRLAEAHSALAFVLLQYDGNWPAAEQAHRRCIELDPNFASGHDWYALGLIEMGRFADARIQLELARALDPLSLIINAHLGWLYYFERDYERSVAQLERTLELSPDYGLALYFLGATYIQMKQFNRALTTLQRAAEVSQNHPGVFSAMIHALGAGGREEEARKGMAELKALAVKRYVPPYFIAYALAGFQDERQAIDYLEHASDEGAGWAVHRKVSIEPAFDRLRAHPRFQRLLKQIEKTAVRVAAGESK